jgi:hypothetical protein
MNMFCDLWENILKYPVSRLWGGSELAHSPLVPSIVCSMLPRGFGPHLHPLPESSRVAGVDPPHL